MAQHIAVILSGCGHFDGAEIRESVLTLLALSKAGANVQIAAPDIMQREVINHQTGEVSAEETRNVLAESARIARGDIVDLDTLRAEDFDALILPGGFGAAKQLSDLALGKETLSILPELARLLQTFHRQNKPIGAICIAPALLAAALETTSPPTLTLGTGNGEMLEKIGAKAQDASAKEIVIDQANKLVSTPAYMLDAPLHHIAEGVEQLVHTVLSMAAKQQEAA